MKATGKMIRELEKEDAFMLMVISMKVIGKMIWLMEKEN